MKVLEDDLTGYLDLTVSPAVIQRVKSSVRRFSNNCSAYCLLPEAEFDCTRLEVDEFLMSRLRQTVSQKGSKTLIEKLAERVSLSQGRVWKLMESPEMSDPEVAGRVSTAISATQPYLSITLGGSFEGLLGQLGLNLADGSSPPLSQREGYIRRFGETISKLFRDKGVDFDDDWIDQVVRNWHHRDEFEKRYASKAPAGVGGPLLPGLLQYLDQLHEREMENLEQDLDFGEPEGAEIWESFKEDEVPHPRNLLEQMWRLVQQNVRAARIQLRGMRKTSPILQTITTMGELQTQGGGPGGDPPPDGAGAPGAPAALSRAFMGPPEVEVEQQQLNQGTGLLLEAEQQEPFSEQQLVVAPAETSKPPGDPFGSLPPMRQFSSEGPRRFSRVLRVSRPDEAEEGALEEGGVPSSVSTGTGTERPGPILMGRATVNIQELSSVVGGSSGIPRRLVPGRKRTSEVRFSLGPPPKVARSGNEVRILGTEGATIPADPTQEATVALLTTTSDTPQSAGLALSTVANLASSVLYRAAQGWPTDQTCLCLVASQWDHMETC